MKLAYTQRPQDGSADAAVHLILAPSYVTYSAATVERVMDFFRTEEVGVGCLQHVWVVGGVSITW